MRSKPRLLKRIFRHRAPRLILGIVLCISLSLGSVAPGSAEPTLEETRALLQKGLNLAELDQEIARLSAQDMKLAGQIAETEQSIASNQEKVEKTREHAGKVLRAYYMGERVNIWMLVLSARSMSDAISIYEYFNLLVQNDHRTLNAYADSYNSLVTSRELLQKERQELADVKASFLAQREKAVTIAQEIETVIATSPDGETLRHELDRFTVEWKEKGVPMFRKYLASISEAMQSLPELLTGKNASTYIKDIDFKTGMVFEISDTDLTTFFRSKNPLFNNISFRFENDELFASGREDGVDVSIKGHYTIENKTVNKLQFHVDQLTYSSFVLPETSNRSLEEEFDLGFTPSLFLKGISVTEVSMKNSILRLRIKQ
jgi:hypothetical protein